MKRAPQYRLFAPDGSFVGPIVEHESAKIVHKWFETGTGTIVINGEPDSDLFARALNVHNEPLLISVYSDAPHPWTGRVHNAEYVDDGDGPALELTLVNDRIWMDAILALQSSEGGDQSGSETDEREGSLRGVVYGFLSDAIARLGIPMVIVPQPDDDASPSVRLSARMTSMSELVKDALLVSGYTLSVRTYRTGDRLPTGIASLNHGDIVVEIVAPRDNPNLLWQQEQLVTFSLASQEPSAHTIWLGATGTGTSRNYYQYTDTALKISQRGLGLPEVYEDSGGTSSPALVGPRALKQHSGGVSVNFSVEDEHPWIFGIDWLPGDFAYARIAGSVWRAQITEVEMDETEGAGVLYTPKCGVAGQLSAGDRDVLTNAMARLISDIKTRRARV